MLEIVYDIATNEVRAWNTDPNSQGNLIPKDGKALVVWDIEPPTEPSDVYYVVPSQERIIPNPDYVPIEPMDYRREIDELKSRVNKVEARRK